MSNKKYKLIFSGEVSQDKDVKEVKRNMASLLKLNNRQIENLFSGRRFVIKKAADASTVKAFKAAFEKAGAVLIVEAAESKKPSRARIEPESVKATPAPKTEKTNARDFDEPSDREDKRPRDLPVIVFVVTALILILALGGYVLWKGIKPWSHSPKIIS